MASAATEKPNAQVVQDNHTPNFRRSVIFRARDYSRVATFGANVSLIFVASRIRTAQLREPVHLS
jgi:hypothetical protein